jgi:trans-aconitate 2-methyltransferase
MWDARQYLKYSDERSRPFIDLLARVQREQTDFIADLGCGPGNLTRILTERWPAAKVVGLDNSPEMLEQARTLACPGRLDFVEADIASWSPEQPIDLVISNAALQWVPDHATLVNRLVKMLAPGGTLAIQMPVLFENPAHIAIEATTADSRWQKALGGVGLHQKSVKPLHWYVERLHNLALVVDGWQTTYIHFLEGDNPVLEWYKGTALRPLLSRLEPQFKQDFLDELGSRLKAEYPARGGVTLLPFPRMFFVATLS